MRKIKFSKISSIISDAKKGKMFILVDDKDRESVTLKILILWLNMAEV